VLLQKYVIWCYLAEKRKSTSSAQACQITQSGEGYTGHINRTISGIPCQRWSIKQPHEHAYDDITYFADHSINAAAIVQDVVNYCRNPSVMSHVDAQPWCFTTNKNIEKEYCNIPRCKGKRAMYKCQWLHHHHHHHHHHVACPCSSCSVVVSTISRYCSRS